MDSIYVMEHGWKIIYNLEVFDGFSYEHLVEIFEGFVLDGKYEVEYHPLPGFTYEDSLIYLN